MKKYELISEPGRSYFRVRAIRDFGNVKAGELGGLVDSPEVLSHEGSCWIGGHAIVSCGARVTDDAIVTGNALVSGKVTLAGKVHVKGWVQLQGQDVALSGALSLYADMPEKGPPATRAPKIPHRPAH